mmetsp:Transcript_49210/g.100482  ORF Transcript_49210/g.100482 Transcript_49210/m.100482 type:complete len:292 (+) Transcript_49210:67-942(+)
MIPSLNASLLGDHKLRHVDDRVGSEGVDLRHFLGRQLEFVGAKILLHVLWIARAWNDADALLDGPPQHDLCLGAVVVLSDGGERRHGVCLGLVQTAAQREVACHLDAVLHVVLCDLRKPAWQPRMVLQLVHRDWREIQLLDCIHVDLPKVANANLFDEPLLARLRQRLPCGRAALSRRVAAEAHALELCRFAEQPHVVAREVDEHKVDIVQLQLFQHLSHPRLRPLVPEVLSWGDLGCHEDLLPGDASRDCILDALSDRVVIQVKLSSIQESPSLEQEPEHRVSHRVVVVG